MTFKDDRAAAGQTRWQTREELGDYKDHQHGVGRENVAWLKQQWQLQVTQSSDHTQRIVLTAAH